MNDGSYLQDKTLASMTEEKCYLKYVFNDHCYLLYCSGIVTVVVEIKIQMLTIVLLGVTVVEMEALAMMMASVVMVMVMAVIIVSGGSCGGDKVLIWLGVVN